MTDTTQTERIDVNVVDPADDPELVTLKTLGVIDIKEGDILLIQPDYKLPMKRFVRFGQMLDGLLKAKGLKDVTAWFVPHDVKVGVLRANCKPERVVDVTRHEDDPAMQ